MSRASEECFSAASRSVVERHGVLGEGLIEVLGEFQHSGPEGVLRAVLLQPRLEPLDRLGVHGDDPSLGVHPEREAAGRERSICLRRAA